MSISVAQVIVFMFDFLQCKFVQSQEWVVLYLYCHLGPFEWHLKWHKQFVVYFRPDQFHVPKVLQCERNIFSREQRFFTFQPSSTTTHCIQLVYNLFFLAIILDEESFFLGNRCLKMKLPWALAQTICGGAIKLKIWERNMKSELTFRVRLHCLLALALVVVFASNFGVRVGRGTLNTSWVKIRK